MKEVFKDFILIFFLINYKKQTGQILLDSDA